MAHFAKVEDGVVTQVIVAEQDVIDSGLFGAPSSWVQTSYNTRGGQHPEDRPLRKNYAGIGYTYDATRDAFIPPQPFTSWVLNEDTCLWNAPIPRPQDDKAYEWDEATTSWVEVVVPEIMEETVLAAEVVVDGGVEPMVLSSSEPTITLDSGNDSITLNSAEPTI